MFALIVTVMYFGSNEITPPIDRVFEDQASCVNFVQTYYNDAVKDNTSTQKIHDDFMGYTETDDIGFTSLVCQEL